MALLRRRSPPPLTPPAATGVAPDGTPVVVEVSAGRWELLFLTSSCAPCRDVWETLRRHRVPRVVIVTPGPATEDRHKVAQLAPAAIAVVMSSETWFAYRPGPAPWRVVLEDGEVREAGPANLRQPGA